MPWPESQCTDGTHRRKTVKRFFARVEPARLRATVCLAPEACDQGFWRQAVRAPCRRAQTSMPSARPFLSSGCPSASGRSGPGATPDTVTMLTVLSVKTVSFKLSLLGPCGDGVDDLLCG